MFKWYSYFTTENFFQNLFLSESSRTLIKKNHFLKNISLFTFNIICKFCIQANPFNPGDYPIFFSKLHCLNNYKSTLSDLIHTAVKILFSDALD